MTLDPVSCYRAMVTHDARFDGCFFVAVRSTRVYCRPVCRVRLPKLENCTFFATATAAEARGYRPCLRCRPELAPGNVRLEAGQQIAQSAARLIEDGWLEENGLEGIAGRLGVTGRHLRRVFHQEFGVTPVAFAQTRRLLAAKQLLTDTRLPVTEVAYSAGFQSLRRFGALFRERYRLTPSELRKKAGRERADALEFELGYRPPYDWAAIAGFLGARTIPGVEVVEEAGYRRIAQVESGGAVHRGWVQVMPDAERAVMRVRMDAKLAKGIPQVLARVRHLFDLGAHPAEIAEALGGIGRKGLRVPGAFDGFEVAVRAVLGQQVSVAAARTLAGRFAAAFGTKIETPDEDLHTAFPRAAEIAGREADQIRTLGILPARARTILELAQAIAEGRIDLTPGVPVDPVIGRLKEIHGIGEWTAQYIAMRALAWPDAFPHSDLGLMRALGEKRPAKVLEAGERWRPWRAYAVMHFWTGEKADAVGN